MENNNLEIITQTFVNGINLHVFRCYTKAKAKYNRAQICEPQICHDLVHVIPLPLTYNSLFMPCEYILIVPHWKQPWKLSDKLRYRHTKRRGG